MTVIIKFLDGDIAAFTSEDLVLNATDKIVCATCTCDGEDVEYKLDTIESIMVDNHFIWLKEIE